jgi:hypothetical protein
MADRGVIVSLCDLTGKMVEPWVRAGYRAVLVDPQHPAGISTDGPVTRVGHVIDHPETWRVLRDLDRVVFVAGFPPCTDLAVSGARWFALKAGADPAFQFKAMHVVWQCHAIAQMLGAPWFIENPVSRISSFWRKPNHAFSPHQFTGFEPGDNYTKKTCLWTGGGFVMPPEFKGEGLGDPDDRIHKAAPGPDRANFRSATPMGFARAVFEANAPHLHASSVAISTLEAAE